MAIPRSPGPKGGGGQPRRVAFRQTAIYTGLGGRRAVCRNFRPSTGTGLAGEVETIVDAHLMAGRGYHRGQAADT